MPVAQDTGSLSPTQVTESGESGLSLAGQAPSEYITYIHYILHTSTYICFGDSGQMNRSKKRNLGLPGSAFLQLFSFVAFDAVQAKGSYAASRIGRKLPSIRPGGAEVGPESSNT